MENEIIELMTEFMAENRLPKLLFQDEEYQAANIRELKVHEDFVSTLSPEQEKLYDDFVASSAETEANLVRVVYQQGMRDFYNLLQSLEIKKE